MAVKCLRLAARASVVVSIAALLAGCSISQRDDEDADQPELLASEDVSTPDDVAADQTPEAAADPAKGDVLLLGGGVGGSFKFGDKTGLVQASKTGTVEFFDVNKAKFAASGKLTRNRFGATSSVIDGGPLDDQALVTGGLAGKADIKRSVMTLDAEPIGTGEAFNPDSEKSKKISDALGTARAFHTETTLPDGRVVIAGGYGDDYKPLNSIEIFNPATRAFTAAGVMSQPRAFHTATLLPNGQILFTGGVVTAAVEVTSTAETYNPATATSTLTATRMKSPTGDVSLAAQTATLISGCGCAADGKVLLTGGFSSFAVFGPALTSSATTVMVYDPATRAFSAAGVPQMREERVFQSATLLADGKVLLAGGLFGQVQVKGTKISGLYGGMYGSAEIFDPAKNTLVCVDGPAGADACKPSLVNARFGHAAVLLSTGPLKGQVLLVGGVGGKDRKKLEAGFGAPLKSAETFNPKTEAFKSAGAMKAARIFPATAIVP